MSVEDLIDELTDLMCRMDEAEVKLVELAEDHKPLSHDKIRLSAKAAGVALARGYTREALQRVKATR